mmetsp:Transcript_4736/g.14287  ORF Transcript_4736/g.14287 Transcript_4736/m.14287 type:complete len:223 (+) Transcript_4736:1173-1841(+)
MLPLFLDGKRDFSARDVRIANDLSSNDKVAFVIHLQNFRAMKTVRRPVESFAHRALVLRGSSDVFFGPTTDGLYSAEESVSGPSFWRQQSSPYVLSKSPVCIFTDILTNVRKNWPNKFKLVFARMNLHRKPVRRWRRGVVFQDTVHVRIKSGVRPSKPVAPNGELSVLFYGLQTENLCRVQVLRRAVRSELNNVSPPNKAAVFVLDPKKLSSGLDVSSPYPQ